VCQGHSSWHTLLAGCGINLTVPSDLTKKSAGLNVSAKANLSTAASNTSKAISDRIHEIPTNWSNASYWDA